MSARETGESTCPVWPDGRETDLDMQARAAAICCVCKCSVDVNAPHAIIKFEYAHLNCADAYDAGVSHYYSRTGRALDDAYNRRSPICH